MRVWQHGGPAGRGGVRERSDAAHEGRGEQHTGLDEVLTAGDRRRDTCRARDGSSSNKRSQPAGPYLSRAALGDLLLLLLPLPPHG